MRRGSTARIAAISVGMSSLRRRGNAAGRGWVISELADVRASRPVLGGEVQWAIATAVAILAAAAWLASPRVAYVVACLAATALALGITAASTARSRRWPAATGASLLVFIVLALAAQRTTWRIDNAWDGYSREAIARGARALERTLAAAADDLATRAQQ